MEQGWRPGRNKADAEVERRADLALDSVILVFKSILTVRDLRIHAACPPDVKPCPCGYYGDPKRQCRCSPGQIERYRQRISGPLLDRIDLHVEVPLVDLGSSHRTRRAGIRLPSFATGYGWPARCKPADSRARPSSRTRRWEPAWCVIIASWNPKRPPGPRAASAARLFQEPSA